MTYLVVANLVLTVAIIAVACGFAIKAHRKRKRRRGARIVSGGDYPARSDWKRKPRSLNYSSFVYIDVDRDGRYGLSDRPMSAAVVHLSGADGPVHAARTNVNGFANFTMSTTARDGHFRSPGTFRFAVSIPPGWVCTSNNDVQEMAFRLIEGSPAGIGADEMVRPVGLAPLRTVKGRVQDGAAVIVRFVGGGAPIGQAELPAGAAFNLDTPTNADSIELSSAQDGVSRELTLSGYPTELGALAAASLAFQEGALETIDFDGVTAKGLRKIPNGYFGLNWFNLNATARDFHPGSQGYVNGNTSGDNSCYTSSGHPGELWSDRPFGFHSVMLSSAWLSSEGETCVVESWRGQEMVARDEIAVSALGPVHYAPMLAGITRIRFSSRHYWQIVLDDLVIAR